LSNTYIGVVIGCKLLQDAFHSPEHLEGCGLCFANQTLHAFMDIGV